MLTLRFRLNGEGLNQCKIIKYNTYLVGSFLACRPIEDAAHQVLKDAESIGSFTIRNGCTAAAAFIVYELEDMANPPFTKCIQYR